MSNRVLDFANYIGGPDVQVIELFPRSQKAFTYNFGSNVSLYSFSADYQTIVLDTLTYDRTTGEPNFTDTNVIGYFANVGVVSGSNISTADAASGYIKLTIPENRYTGNITPNARTNVVMTVLSFQWETDDTPVPQKDMHRWAIIERWEAGVSTGDPTQETVANGGYVAL